jgi:hypothetical protein
MLDMNHMMTIETDPCCTRGQRLMLYHIRGGCLFIMTGIDVHYNVHNKAEVGV